MPIRFVSTALFFDNKDSFVGSFFYSTFLIYLRTENRCAMATSEKKLLSPEKQIRIWQSNHPHDFQIEKSVVRWSTGSKNGLITNSGTICMQQWMPNSVVRTELDKRAKINE